MVKFVDIGKNTGGEGGDLSTNARPVRPTARVADQTPSGAHHCGSAPARRWHSERVRTLSEHQCSMDRPTDRPVTMRSAWRTRHLDEASVGYRGEPECPSARMFP